MSDYPTCPFCGVLEPCRVHVVAPAGLPPATPQEPDVAVLLKQWDTHQSALRALVEQWNKDADNTPDDYEAAARMECAAALSRLLEPQA